MKKRFLSITLLCIVLTYSAFATGSKEKAPAPAVEATASHAVSSNIEYTAKSVNLVSEDFIDPLKDWKKYDNLISSIKTETDNAKRTEMMQKAEDILMSNWAILPLYYYNDVYLQKPYVNGIYSNPSGTKFFWGTNMANGSKILRVNLASEPAYLDPALNSTVDGACLVNTSFSGLYTYDKDGHTIPACAECYTVSDDGLTYTVTLKKGLKWSDGSALTAEDFEYSWKRVTDPATAADYEYMFSGFEGYGQEINVKAVDDTTLVFVLSAPCAYIEDLLAFSAFFPVKQSAVEAEEDWKTTPNAWCRKANFVSNGPFVCKSWNHDISMIYEKNPYWYDADKVSIDTIEFMLSADTTAVFAAYCAENIDFADSVPTDEVQNLLSNPEFRTVDNLGTYYCAFNVKSKLFEGKTPEQAACMRKAFCILIDRDYICSNIAQTGQKPANSFIPLKMLDGNGGTFKKDVYDGYFDVYGINNNRAETVAKAIELLKFAGFKFENGKLSEETPIDIVYLTNTGTDHIAVAESMQQDLAEIGIKITIQTQDWNVFIQERKRGNYDFAREGWLADFNDPINMLEIWTTDSGNNDCQFGH